MFDIFIIPSEIKLSSIISGYLQKSWINLISRPQERQIKLSIFYQFIILSNTDVNFLDNLARMEPIDLYNWLIKRRLIPDNQLCNHCGLAMAIKLAKHTSDGLNWRCKNSECDKYKTTLSIRTDLCIVDTSTQPATGFATLISDRQTKAISPIIKRVVRQGSITQSNSPKIVRGFSADLD